MRKEMPFFREIFFHIMVKNFIYVFFFDRDCEDGNIVGKANWWGEALTVV